MPRIQTFVSNQVREEIESLVTERRQEGVTENDATVSSVTSMLIELGLRVYRIQREKKESGFNQMEYNKLMLDNISRVRFMCSEISSSCYLYINAPCEFCCTRCFHIFFLNTVKLQFCFSPPFV